MWKAKERNLKEAKGYYRKDLEISEELLKETGTLESKRDAAISYGRMGDVAKVEGNLEEAKVYEELEECGTRLMEYKECFEIMGKDRNSYSKTDLEATFMWMKGKRLVGSFQT